MQFSLSVLFLLCMVGSVNRRLLALLKQIRFRQTLPALFRRESGRAALHELDNVFACGPSIAATMMLGTLVRTEPSGGVAALLVGCLQLHGQHSSQQQQHCPGTSLSFNA